MVWFIFRIDYVAKRYSVVLRTNELQCGDHIAYPMEWSSSWPELVTENALLQRVLPYHHAIVLAVMGGSKVKVIHVLPTQKTPDGSLIYEVVEQQIDVGDDIENRNLWRYEYEPGQCYDPDEVIVRAKKEIGHFKYDFIFNNCEHFARGCKTDKKVSVQVRRAEAVLIIAGGVVLGVIAVVAGVYLARR